MLANRMARELKMLAADPPPGVAAWPVGDSTTQLRAQIRVRKSGNGRRMRPFCFGSGERVCRTHRCARTRPQWQGECEASLPGCA